MSRKTPPFPPRSTEQEIAHIAYQLYQNRQRMGKLGSAAADWATATEIQQDSLRYRLFRLHQPFITLEKTLWEPILAWSHNQALLSLLGIVGNISLIIAAGAYIGTEKQRRDAEVFNAWQTITSAYGQAGSGGRIQALEFLNASPGANWRRKFPWFCAPLPLCTWPAESLAGTDLSVPTDDSVLTAADENPPGGYLAGMQLQGVYLVGIQLPRASLGSANLSDADLWSANLSHAYLSFANLNRANLNGANLNGANLWFTNLSQANLPYADLSAAYLSFANLRAANLEDANLEDAHLSSAYLSFADLENANLSKANLWSADLWSANLSNADLGHANLWSANLSHADLRNTNLSNADLRNTNLSKANLRNTDLSGAILLATDLRKTSNLTVTQLTAANPPLLCGVALPIDVMGIDPNRDCDAMPQVLVNRYEGLFLEEAQGWVEEARAIEWE